ncbi:hypothetical protein KYX90_13545 [Enterococcus lactis]|nr:hypothetical protein [Enterococcus lactis]MBX4221185.1 hypothetical protein [Enterococcus lactis]
MFKKTYKKKKEKTSNNKASEVTDNAKKKETKSVEASVKNAQNNLEEEAE